MKKYDLFFAFKYDGTKRKNYNLRQSDLLAAVRQLAHDEGLQIQAIVEDALREHLTAQDNTKARGREHVMAAYLKSTERFPGLYKKLAQ